jgi:rfaE bifunctional protein nucleotidyltransferase chain/domain
LRINNSSKIKSRKALVKILSALKKKGKKIVFTNGCFDLLHAGHVKLFKAAKSLGHVLVLGLNSDSSLKKLKGSKRPLVTEKARAEVLSAIDYIDYIVIFREDTPYEIIRELRPHVLVKGGDYKLEDIAGRQFVRKVVRFKLVKGYSTTNLIKKIVKAYGR